MKKYLLISFLLISLFLPSDKTFAQDNLLEQPDKPNNININSNQNSVNINVKNLKLDKKVYNTGDTINGSITFVNQKNTDQSGVYYTLLLSGEYSIEQGRYNLPDKTYDGKTLGPVFVPAGKEVEVNFSYEIPKGISGKKLGIFASGHLLSGLPLGFDNVFIDEIKGDLPMLNIEKAYLEVDGNKHGNQDGPTLYATSTGSMKFEIKNDSKESITITPFVEIFDRNTFGELIKSYKEEPVTIEANSKKEISIKLDNTLDPKVYENKVSFLDSKDFLRAERVTFRYIVGGLIATVQNVVVAKNFEKGKPLDVTVFFSGNPTDINTGTFALIGEALLSVKFFDNDTNNLIGEKSVKDLNFDVDLGSTTLGVIPNENVKNLRVESEIIKDGKVLGKYVTVINVENELKTTSAFGSNIVLIILGLLVLILIATAFIFRRNKKIISISLLLIILIVASAILFLKDDMFKKASAETQIYTPNTTLQTSDSIYVSGNVSESKCQNAKLGITIYSSISGYPMVKQYSTEKAIDAVDVHNWYGTNTAYGFEFPARNKVGSFTANVWYTMIQEGYDKPGYRTGIPLWKWVCDSTKCDQYNRVGNGPNAYLDSNVYTSWPYSTGASKSFNVSCPSGQTWNGSSCVTPVNAVCNNSQLYSCSAGSGAESGSGSVVYGQNGEVYDKWTCLGSNGGTNQNDCYKQRPPVNATCSGTLYGCSAGDGVLVNSGYVTTVDGKKFDNWICRGSNGGANRNCQKAQPTPPPPPTNLTTSCSADGKTVTVSWNDAAGYPITYFRARVDGENYGWNNYVEANTYNLTVTPGKSYYIWIHSRNVDNGDYSRADVSTTINCSIPAPTDLCNNITGDQSTVPTNTTRQPDGSCTCTNNGTNPPTCPPPPPTDQCNNITGVQSTVPGNTTRQPDGSCTCTNGATNPTTCTTCSSTQEMVSGTCVNKCAPNTTRQSNGSCACTNGGTNPPTCTAPTVTCQTGSGLTMCTNTNPINQVCARSNFCPTLTTGTTEIINLNMTPSIVNSGGKCKATWTITKSTISGLYNCKLYNVINNTEVTDTTSTSGIRVSPGGEYRVVCTPNAGGNSIQSTPKKCILNPSVIEI